MAAHFVPECDKSWFSDRNWAILCSFGHIAEALLNGRPPTTPDQEFLSRRLLLRRWDRAGRWRTEEAALTRGQDTGPDDIPSDEEGGNRLFAPTGLKEVVVGTGNLHRPTTNVLEIAQAFERYRRVLWAIDRIGLPRSTPERDYRRSLVGEFNPVEECWICPHCRENAERSSGTGWQRGFNKSRCRSCGAYL